MTTAELSLKNASKDTLRAHTDCISWFDVLVVDENGTSAFDWRDYVIETEYNGAAPQCPSIWKDLAPGETLDQSVSFLVDEPGEYTVRPQPPSETVGNVSPPIDLSLAVKVRAK